jgi:hypothetical protein
VAVRLEGSPAVVEKLASREPSKSSPEVVSFAQEWRAEADKRENWISLLDLTRQASKKHSFLRRLKVFCSLRFQRLNARTHHYR